MTSSFSAVKDIAKFEKSALTKATFLVFKIFILQEADH